MPRAQYFVTNRNGEWKIRAGYRYSGPYPAKREALQAAMKIVASGRRRHGSGPPIGFPLSGDRAGENQ